MADDTLIEWARHPVTGKGATWNPITGCTLVSDGCRHCYAARLAATRLKHHPSRKGLARLNAAGEAKFTGEVRFNEEWLTQPLRWKRPRMIFVCAHGDLFHESVPDEWIDRIFAVMALAPQHSFQVLTKRSKRMRTYLDRGLGRIADTIISLRRAPGDANMAIVPLPHVTPGRAWWPLPNVWLGVSAENQATADERIPDLLATVAAIRFVSAEPLLGPIDFTRIDEGVHDDFKDCGGHPDPHYPLESVGWGRTDALRGEYWGTTQTPDRTVHLKDEQLGFTLPGLDQIIVGGESGAQARPMHPDWPRSIRDQCKAAGVSFFFKQWGEWAPTIGALDWNEIDDDPEISRFDHLEWDGSDWGLRYRPMRDQEPTEDEVARIGKKMAGRRLDGVEHNALPGRRP